MTFAIEILPAARREWQKLDPHIKLQATRKLESLLENPRVEAARLSGMPDCYRLKLRSAGFRIIYQVFDSRLVVLIVAAGKRDAGKADVYDTALGRVQMN